MGIEVFVIQRGWLATRLSLGGIFQGNFVGFLMIDFGHRGRPLTVVPFPRVGIDTGSSWLN